MIKPRKEIQKMAPLPRGSVKGGDASQKMIRLSVNENPLGVSVGAVEAGKIAAAKGSLYPDANGEELRRAIGSFLGIAADQIFLGNGIGDLFSLLGMLYLNRGDEIIVPAPSYWEYERYASMYGAVTKRIPLNEDSVVDLPAMVAAVSLKTKMLVICNPNDPTGTVINKRLFLQMLHRIGSDVLVVIDEAYIEYVEDADAPIGTDFLKKFPNVVVLRTFSHAYGLAGFRAAYAIAGREVVEEAEKILPPYTLNAAAQAAALAAVLDKEFLKKSVRYNKVERDYLQAVLKTLGLTALPSQANFLLVDMKMDSVKVCDFLRGKGILVCGGDIYGYPKAIRVSVGLRKENKKLLDALKILLYRERQAKAAESE